MANGNGFSPNLEDLASRFRNGNYPDVQPQSGPSMQSYNPTMSQYLRNWIAGPQSSPTLSSIADQLFGTGATTPGYRYDPNTGQYQEGGPSTRDLNVFNATGVPDLHVGQLPNTQEMMSTGTLKIEPTRFNPNLFDVMHKESGTHQGDMVLRYLPDTRLLRVQSWYGAPGGPNSLDELIRSGGGGKMHELRSLLSSMQDFYPYANMLRAWRSRTDPKNVGRSSNPWMFPLKPRMEPPPQMPQNISSDEFMRNWFRGY